MIDKKILKLVNKIYMGESLESKYYNDNGDWMYVRMGIVRYYGKVYVYDVECMEEDGRERKCVEEIKNEVEMGCIEGSVFKSISECEDKMLEWGILEKRDGELLWNIDYSMDKYDEFREKYLKKLY